MDNLKEQEKIDALIKHFWRSGFLTLSRKYSKYLPAPNKIGDYEVDAIAKYKRKIAIGITLSEAELNDPATVSKINYLAGRDTKYSNNNIVLFIGVNKEHVLKAKMMLLSLPEEIKRNVKIVPINQQP